MSEVDSLLAELDLAAAEWDALSEWMKPIGVDSQMATREVVA